MRTAGTACAALRPAWVWRASGLLEENDALAYTVVQAGTVVLAIVGTIVAAFATDGMSVAALAGSHGATAVAGGSACWFGFGEIRYYFTPRMMLKRAIKGQCNQSICIRVEDDPGCSRAGQWVDEGGWLNLGRKETGINERILVDSNGLLNGDLQKSDSSQTLTDSGNRVLVWRFGIYIFRLCCNSS